MLEDSVHFSIESQCLVDLFKIVFDDRLQVGNIQVHLIEGWRHPCCSVWPRPAFLFISLKRNSSGFKENSPWIHWNLLSTVCMYNRRKSVLQKTLLSGIIRGSRLELYQIWEEKLCCSYTRLDMMEPQSSSPYTYGIKNNNINGHGSEPVLVHHMTLITNHSTNKPSGCMYQYSRVVMCT